MTDKDRLGDNPFESTILGERTSDKQGKQSKHETRPNRGGRPRKHVHKLDKASQEGLPPGWSRATFILREEAIEGLKALAWYDRKPLKEYLDGLLLETLKKQKHLAEALDGYRASLTKTKTGKRR